MSSNCNSLTLLFGYAVAQSRFWRRICLWDFRLSSLDSKLKAFRTPSCICYNPRPYPDLGFGGTPRKQKNFRRDLESHGSTGGGTLGPGGWLDGLHRRRAASAKARPPPPPTSSGRESAVEAQESSVARASPLRHRPRQFRTAESQALFRFNGCVRGQKESCSSTAWVVCHPRPCSSLRHVT